LIGEIHNATTNSISNNFNGNNNEQRQQQQDSSVAGGSSRASVLDAATAANNTTASNNTIASRSMIMVGIYVGNAQPQSKSSSNTKLDTSSSIQHWIPLKTNPANLISIEEKEFPLHTWKNIAAQPVQRGHIYACSINTGNIITSCSPATCNSCPLMDLCMADVSTLQPKEDFSFYGQVIQVGNAETKTRASDQEVFTIRNIIVRLRVVEEETGIKTIADVRIALRNDDATIVPIIGTMCLIIHSNRKIYDNQMSFNVGSRGVFVDNVKTLEASDILGFIENFQNLPRPEDVQC
jgi:hypothetical protein